MNRIDRIQAVQEEEYSFPYHYVSGTNGGFHQCLNFWWGINYEATIEFLLDRLRRETFESIVDIGCGDGRLVKELGCAFPNRQVCGLDYSQRAINLACAMHPAGDYRACDITELRSADTFDVGLLIEVLEHVPPNNVPDFVAAVQRLLSRDGVLHLTVPHVNEPLTRKHYQHFTLDSLLELLGGFEVEEVVFLEKKSKAKRRIDRLLTNKYVIVNHKKVLNWIYGYYKKNLFVAENEQACCRLYLKLRKA